MSYLSKLNTRTLFPPWETSLYGVVSLLDVLLFAANDFCWVVTKLIGLYCFPEGAALALSAHFEVLDAIDLAEKFSDRCNLISAKKQITRIRSGGHLERGSDMRDLKPLVGELIRRIQEDLTDVKLLQVATGRAPYLSETPEDLSSIYDRFPGAYDELTAARQCFALLLEQASVFHSMRALEIGLNVLANSLGVSFAKPDWYNLIQGIEAAIRELSDAKATSDSRKRQKFLAQAATDFRYFKDAWRNHVMHGRDRYTEREAKKIMESVADFMLTLSREGFEQV